MQAGVLPAFLDITALASKDALLEGRLDPKSLSRLGSAVVRVDEAAAQLEVRPDGFGGLELILHVSGLVVVNCQRCLGEMQLRLDGQTAISVDAAGEIGNDDAEEMGIDDGRVNLRAWVEDELILALPAVARHGYDDDCRAGKTSFGDGAPATPQSPFAVLATLRDGHGPTDDTDSGDD